MKINFYRTRRNEERWKEFKRRQQTQKKGKEHPTCVQEESPQKKKAKAKEHSKKKL